VTETIRDLQNIENRLFTGANTADPAATVPFHSIASLSQQLLGMLTTVNFSDPGNTADIIKENKALKLQIQVLESQLELQKAQILELTKDVAVLKAEQANSQGHSIAYEIVDLMETLVSLDNGASRGRKQSFAKFLVTTDRKEVLREDLQIEDIEDYISFAENIKEARRPHGHINNKEINYSQQQILEVFKETGASEQDMEYATKTLNAWKTRCVLYPGHDRPFLSAYIQLNKEIPKEASQR